MERPGRGPVAHTSSRTRRLPAPSLPGPGTRFPIRRVPPRCRADRALAALVDTGGLARAVCAGFIGLELFEGVEPAGAQSALDALDRMAALVEVVDDLGPVARRALRAKLRRST